MYAIRSYYEHPAVAEAARAALEQWGYGLASVRFICGTQGVHKQLEASLSEFLGVITSYSIHYTKLYELGIARGMHGKPSARHAVGVLGFNTS